MAESRLDGRRALVTGGAGGIGRACARRLAAAGAQVTVLDFDGEGAKHAAAEIGAETVVMDLADLQAVDRLDCPR